jgi:phosphoribosyl 1,2-cyclic phosphodiesterase
MRVTFWGVRGSVPTPDEPQARYGGNTACVEVRLPDGSSVALDAGTGLRWLVTGLMENGPTGHRVDILLSHYHWDHIQGLPFTPIMYIPGNTIRIFGMAGPVSGLRDNLLGQLRPDFCPVPNFILPNVGAEVSLHELHEETSLDLGSATLKWRRLPRGHSPVEGSRPGGGVPTVTGYRLEASGKSVAYLTDVDYAGQPSLCQAALELAEGADLLIHDGQYLPEELTTRAKRGHSTYEDAVELARIAGCRQVALIHHDPSRTDDELDQLGDRLARLSGPPMFPAREGLVLDL